MARESRPLSAAQTTSLNKGGATLRQPRAVRYFALEQRVLLDAAAAATLEAVTDIRETPDDAGRDDLSELVAHLATLYRPEAEGRAVLFVDARVPDIETLLAGIDATRVEIHLLDPKRDGLAQIAEALRQGGEPATSVHIISHGSTGQLTLGSSSLDGASIDAFGSALADIGATLSADADIFLYGCNVAADDAGKGFVGRLAALTGADVAASDDLTGSANLGGDWDLEYALGEVSRELALGEPASAWEGILADGFDQDPDAISGTWATATTVTSDGREYKFVSAPTASNGVIYVYYRDTANGNWVQQSNAVFTQARARFGWDMAAVGNRLVVSAPETGGGGEVVCYTYNTTNQNWSSNAVQVITKRAASGSRDDGADRFGYSIDIAKDAGANYRLIIGNPNEDWWDDAYYGTSNERYNAGASHVYTVADHTSNFAFSLEIVSQQGGTTGNGHLFGGVVGVARDIDSNQWWYASGGDGLNAIRLYLNPAANIGGGTFTQSLAWDSAGQNDIALDDDYMVIANAGGVQAYKLVAAGTSYTAIGTSFGAGGAVVAIDDFDQSGAGDTVHGARVIYSGGGATYAMDCDSTGQFVPLGQINARTEVSVSVDRLRGLDVLTANNSSALSYHYNWDPDVTNDTLTVNANASGSVNVVSNDTDVNITGFSPSTLFGDVIVVGAVGSPTGLGATVTFTSTTVTYNPTTSSSLLSMLPSDSTQEVVSVTISDGQGGTAVASLTVTINGVNDNPTTVGSPASPYRIQQTGTSINYDVSAYYTDVDTGHEDALTVQVMSGPAWVTTTGQSLVVNIPAGTAAGDYNVSVRAVDPLGGTSGNQTFVIRVDNANNAPILQTPLADQIAVSGYDFNFTVPSTTFLDSDPPPYDTITYTATLVGGGALPSWLSFDSGTRTFSGTVPTTTGTINVRVTANDNAPAHRGGALTAFDDFAITVVNPSQSQTLSPLAYGAATEDNLGFSVSIAENGLWMVVGAPGRTTLGTATIAGYVRLYEWSAGDWVQRVQWSETGSPTVGDFFGYSVAINQDGTKIVVGAPRDDAGLGSVYCYTRTGTGGTTAIGSQGKITATTRTADDRFGSAVAINEAGTFVLIGASGYDYTGIENSGAAFRTGHTTSGTTTLAPNVIAKDPGAGDRFGSDVSYDQNILVVSALSDDNPSGLIGRWQFADGTGTVATATFNGANGTLFSSQFAFDPIRGDVLQLNGASARMELSTVADLGASWTISSWYNGIAPTGTWRTLTRSSTFDHHIILNTSDNQLGMYDNAGATGFNSTGYTLSAAELTGWHLITAVGEGTRTRFYIDGVYKGSVNKKSTDDVFSVGNYQGGGQRFSDYIDDFRVYDRALSESEIRNMYTGASPQNDAYADAGSVYVFSTSMGNGQVAKLYVPAGQLSDFFGFAVDVDIYDVGGAQQSGIIVASAVFNDASGSDGGAVYVWRSDDLQSGGQHNDDPGNAYAGDPGNGTWDLEATVVSYDTQDADYFGNDVAVDYDETLGATRMVVGAPFEHEGGNYSGAMYAFKYLGAGIWAPEKFNDVAPQGGGFSNAGLFGNAVDVAIVDNANVRAVLGSRWRDNNTVTTSNTNEGAVYRVNLLSASASYTTLMSVEADQSFFLAATEQEITSLDTSATQGEVSFDSSGQLVYSAGSAFKSLGLGQTATDTFTYVTQNGGVAYVNTVQVTITGVDDATSAGDDIIQVSASAPTVLNVTANDSDADGGLLQVQSVSGGGLQGLVVATGGQIVYDPNGRFATLRAGQSAQETFTYTVRDESSGVDTTATVTLVVVGEDDPVTAVDDAASVAADGAVTIDVLGNDLDLDGQDTFAVSGVDTTGTLGQVTLGADGAIVYVPGDAFRGLKAGEVGTDRVVYTVRDDSGNESAALLTITVVGVNDAPTAYDDALTAADGASVTVDVTANDVDPDGDAFQVTRVITTGTLGQVTLNGDGTVTYRAPAGPAALDRFSYEVTDALGQTSTATVYVNGGGGSGPALPEARDDVAVSRGAAQVIIPVSANDEGGVLVDYSVATAYGSVSAAEGGVLVFTPGDAANALPAGVVVVDSFQYTIQYADGRTSTATVRVYINGTQSRAVLESDEDRYAQQVRPQVTGAPVVLAPAPEPEAGMVAPEDTVARMALDGLLELAEAGDGSQQESVAVRTAPAKPGLAAVLGHEAQARRAGVDALLRHFSGNAA